MPVAGAEEPKVTEPKAEEPGGWRGLVPGPLARAAGLARPAHPPAAAEGWQAAAERAATGDLLLLSHDCWACDSWGGLLLCTTFKELTNSRWNDVGVVVRGEGGTPLLLEATLEGARLSPLAERLARIAAHPKHSGTVAALRRLDCPPWQGEPGCDELLAYARALEGRPFEQSLWQLFAALVRPESRADREYSPYARTWSLMLRMGLAGRKLVWPRSVPSVSLRLSI